VLRKKHAAGAAWLCDRKIKETFGMERIIIIYHMLTLTENDAAKPTVENGGAASIAARTSAEPAAGAQRGNRAFPLALNPAIGASRERFAFASQD
jgi:hypothetical protein